MNKVAVVILNWNGKKYLEKFLPFVVQNTTLPNTQIYVADNGSSDDSVGFLKENFPNIPIIQLDKNYGFAKGYNLALEQIEAEYFVLLNSDIEVTPNWLEPLINFLDNNRNYAALQPKILSYNQREFFEYAGAAGGFIDFLGYPFCRGRILNEIEKDNGQYNDFIDIFWASGACLVIRADIFKEFKFDDDFFAHMEEIDLCWRLKNSGYKIGFHPESIIYHVGGGSLPNNHPFKLYLNFRNNLVLLLKNLPFNQLLLVIPLRMALDGLAALIFAFKGEFKNFLAIIKAHLYFYKNFFTNFKKRKFAIKTKNLNLHNEILKKSILFEFFIRKKRTFKQLNFK